MSKSDGFSEAKHQMMNKFNYQLMTYVGDRVNHSVWHKADLHIKNEVWKPIAGKVQDQLEKDLKL